MNAIQKEIQQIYLNDEKKVLKNLRSVYKKALDDVNANIAALMGRTDTENLQAIIYRLDYQKALRAQISGVLDSLNNSQFDTVSKYLTECYENGYIGAMYDLSKQGIPLIIPIDQDQVKNALVHDTKLSKKLYTKLGEDVDLLKRRIGANLSRGLAQGHTYAEISRNIRGQGNIALNKTMRIARTEGHRITQQSTFDAQNKAKGKGASILKQWDATLDGMTRESHRHVDGEIRELDEKFSNGLMYPGDSSGGAAEVINCRCVLLQRARWALDDEELEVLKDRAAYFGLDKTQNFEDFKTKYLQFVQEIETKTVHDVDVQLGMTNFSDAFTGKAAEKKNTQLLIDYVNSLPNADQRTLELYNSIGKMDKFSANGIPFSITHTKNHAVTVSYELSSGDIIDVKLNIPKLSGNNLAGQIGTTLHEQMHLIDLMLRDDPTKYGKYFSASNQNLRGIVQKSSGTIGNDVLDLFKNFNAENNALRATLRAEYDSTIDDLKQQFLPNGIWGAGADYKSYKKAANKAWKDIMETKFDYESRNLMGGGINALQDIYDALSGGMYRDNGTVLYGHGSKYYRSFDSRIDEIIANYGALSVTRPDLIDMLRKDDPDLVSALEATIDEMRKKVATIV